MFACRAVHLSPFLSGDISAACVLKLYNARTRPTSLVNSRRISLLTMCILSSRYIAICQGRFAAQFRALSCARYFGRPCDNPRPGFVSDRCLSSKQTPGRGGRRRLRVFRTTRNIDDWEAINCSYSSARLRTESDVVTCLILKSFNSTRRARFRLVVWQTDFDHK